MYLPPIPVINFSLSLDAPGSPSQWTNLPAVDFSFCLTTLPWSQLTLLCYSLCPLMVSLVPEAHLTQLHLVYTHIKALSKSLMKLRSTVSIAFHYLLATLSQKERVCVHRVNSCVDLAPPSWKLSLSLTHRPHSFHILNVIPRPASAP